MHNITTAGAVDRESPPPAPRSSSILLPPNPPTTSWPAPSNADFKCNTCLIRIMTFYCCSKGYSNEVPIMGIQ